MTKTRKHIQSAELDSSGSYKRVTGTFDSGLLFCVTRGGVHCTLSVMVEDSEGFTKFPCDAEVQAAKKVAVSLGL